MRKTTIFTRSMNYRLYEAAMNTIKELPYNHRRLMGTSADGYLIKMLKSNADWAINIDEDAFVINIDALKELIEFCKENNIVNCGMPDGGVVEIRSHNPLVTNPFFNILNLSPIRKEYSKDAVKQYSIHRQQYEEKTPYSLINFDYQYDYYEPYCNFFVWTSQKFKTLYLDAKLHNDGISTILLNHKGVPMIIHTWYSRFYGVDTAHTERIDKIITQYSKKTEENKIRALNDTIINNLNSLYRRGVNKYYRIMRKPVY